MLSTPLALATLLLAAEPVPAQGSVPGAWGFFEQGLGANWSSVPGNPDGQGVIGLPLTLTGGVGIRAGRVRLSPTARFTVEPAVLFPNGGGGLRWSSVALALAATDLLDHAGTGLRLTPVFGLTVPTDPRAFEGIKEFTTLTVAGQLERRFGILELAWRLEGRRRFSLSACDSPAFCSGAGWAFDNRLFAEAWLLPSLSVALGVSWLMSWNAVGANARGNEQHWLQKTARAELVFTWAFARRFGLTLEGTAAALPPAEFPAAWGIAPAQGTTAFGGSLSFWFRTDPSLARNWLER